MKKLLRLHAGKIPVVRINTLANALMFTLLIEKYTFWWVTLTQRNAPQRKRNNYFIPHRIFPVQERIEIVLFSSFFKFWFLMYIQIASNNHNKLMKTLSCNAKKVFQGTWRIKVKNDNSNDTLKLGYNIQTSLDWYVFTHLNGILTFGIW